MFCEVLSWKSSGGFLFFFFFFFRYFSGVVRHLRDFQVTQYVVAVVSSSPNHQWLTCKLFVSCVGSLMQWTLFITALVITSIRSAQKSADHVFFRWQSHVILWENIRRGNANKYTNVWFINELFKYIRYSCFRRVYIKFLYNSKFDFPAKSLVTNPIDITKVLCS